VIAPQHIINYARTDAELEELLLFLIMVAGHRAEIEAIKLEWFLAEREHGETPLQYVWRLECQDSRTVAGESRLMERMRHWRIAPYGTRYNAFRQVAMRVRGRNDPLFLRTCSRADLCRITGISMKTASLFILDSRPDVQMAVLDTHILAEIRERLGYPDAPRQTPQDIGIYLRWERIWLTYCDLAGLDPALADLSVWVRRSDAAASRYRRASADKVLVFA
jgi:hypothetical protein